MNRMKSPSAASTSMRLMLASWGHTSLDVKAPKIPESAGEQHTCSDEMRDNCWRHGRTSAMATSCRINVDSANGWPAFKEFIKEASEPRVADLPRDGQSLEGSTCHRVQKQAKHRRRGAAQGGVGQLNYFQRPQIHMPDVDVGAVVHNVSLECEEIRKSGQPYFAVLERREVDAEGLESVGCDGRHVSGTQVLEILVTGQAELLQALKSFRRKRPLAEQVPAVPPHDPLQKISIEARSHLDCCPTRRTTNESTRASHRPLMSTPPSSNLISKTMFALPDFTILSSTNLHTASKIMSVAGAPDCTLRKMDHCAHNLGAESAAALQ